MHDGRSTGQERGSHMAARCHSPRSRCRSAAPCSSVADADAAPHPACISAESKCIAPAGVVDTRSAYTALRTRGRGHRSPTVVPYLLPLATKISTITPTPPSTTTFIPKALPWRLLQQRVAQRGRSRRRCRRRRRQHERRRRRDGQQRRPRRQRLECPPLRRKHLVQPPPPRAKARLHCDQQLQLLRQNRPQLLICSRGRKNGPSS